ncbi:MAG TPA: Crp/Fnr family transcriptional regulator [Candidatus Sulfotelmatobacter sp.]|nr:Crp/Fnr family transcriptional regulator [Candidatus Sulfotelmatobacter sp.]
MRSSTTLASEPGAAAAHLKSRFLDGLAPYDLKVVLAAARQRHFFANSVVVNQGHPADQLFMLTRGRARFFFDTLEGKKVILLWLTPGEIFGGIALLSAPSTYLVSTETLKDSSMLAWDRPTLRNLAVRYPTLLESALLIASDYLAWYLADHAALISRTARQRLARVLVCLAETIGNKSSDGLEFDATNEELAGAANVTPFTVSRLLSEWQKNRVVLKRRGKILLRSPERLLLHTA